MGVDPGPSPQHHHQLRSTINMKGLVYSGAVLAAVLATAGADDEGSPMITTAMEFLARASSTSEVLTLNLTNLLILLVLKALIFGFGLFSVGGTGRSADTPMVTQADLTGGMCFLMFTSGAEEKLDCIQRTACEDPYLASDYLTAAKMLYKVHKILGMDFQDRYSKTMFAIQEAAEFGKSGSECANAYKW